MNSIFYLNLIPIDIKIFIKENSFQGSKEISDEIKSNIFRLEWKMNDIENFIADVLVNNREVFEAYMYALNNSESKEDFIKNINYYKVLSEFGDEIHKEHEELDNLEYDKYALLELFWGKRIISGKYSKETTQWFFDKLKEIDEVNLLTANNIIRKAIKIELDSEKCTERLISFNSLEKVFSQFKSNKNN